MVMSSICVTELRRVEFCRAENQLAQANLLPHSFLIHRATALRTLQPDHERDSRS